MPAGRKTILQYISKERFNELNKSNNMIAWLHVLTRLIWHVILFWLIYLSIQSSYYFTAALIFWINSITWHFMGYAGLAHELFHGKVFTRKILNLFLFKFFSYVTWNNPYYFENSHSFHHKNTFHEDDTEIYTDFKIGSGDLVRFIIFDYKLFFRRIMYALSNAMGYELTNVSKVELVKFPEEKLEAKIEARRLLITNISIYTVLVILGLRNIAVIVFLTPFVGSFLNRLLAAAQHIGLASNKNLDPLQYSRTLILHTIISFFYANMNYHGEHHLMPSIPFYNLPKLHEVLLLNKDLEREENNIYFFVKDFWKLRSH